MRRTVMIDGAYYIVISHDYEGIFQRDLIKKKKNQIFRISREFAVVVRT